MTIVMLLCVGLIVAMWVRKTRPSIEVSYAVERSRPDAGFHRLRGFGRGINERPLVRGVTP